VPGFVFLAIADRQKTLLLQRSIPYHDPYHVERQIAGMVA
jgi:hypothetical protein